MSDHIKVKFDLESGTFHQQEENDDDEEQYEPLTAIDANIPSMSTYRELYRQSINNSDQFWRTVAKQLHFDRFSDRGLEWNLDSRKGEVFVRFMAGAHTNLAYNCLERNLRKGLGKRVAYRWEGNEPGDEQSITYEQLHKQVVNFSAVLRARGVRKGDVVAIYLPMILELPIAMLACARIGAVHSVVFAGFSADSLASRICHARARVLITADGCYRGNKLIKLKALADHAADICAMHSEPLDHIIVVDHLQRVRVPDSDGKKSAVDENGEDGTNKENTNDSSNISSENITTEDDDIQSEKRRDLSWSEEMAKCREEPSPVEWMESEEPLFILYTSGSTGTPKGILHTTSGYMCHVYLSTKCAFDAQPERDVYWATADCGWITGHSYVVYGPLLNGLTSVIFEGVPSYPDHSRMWAIVEKYGVTKLYTAPTAIRALMAYPERMVTKHDRSTLRVIGTVGEPINPGAWKWLYDVVGERRCAIVDTYWQTETGGHVITPMPYATPTKPGSATLPFFGVVPVLLDHEGRYIEGPGEGNLCFGRPWPGMMRSMWGDHDRFVQTYFSSFKGYYFTGDGARRDDDGYYWITGRVDDLMNVSGHLLSTAEIESALALHPDVVEAAVVSAPHPVKGHFPYAFVTLSNGKKLDDGMVHELKQIVRHKIGAIAIPDVIHEAPGLPKTRSGKVTRRILRKIAEGDKHADLGDTSTLIDETVIARLWENREMLHQATRRTTG